jgi:hypothetical protein
MRDALLKLHSSTAQAVAEFARSRVRVVLSVQIEDLLHFLEEESFRLAVSRQFQGAKEIFRALDVDSFHELDGTITDLFVV